MPHRKRILVIRFGALGDLVMCRQAFADIRAAHADAEIALLTTPLFADFARAMPWFDNIIVAERAPMWRIDKWVSLITKLYRFAPQRVYDLQGKFRQSVIFMLLGGPLWGPEWSGAAPGCSHPRFWPPAPDMHFVDFLAAQLRRADVPAAALGTMDWLGSNIPLPFLQEGLGEDANASTTDSAPSPSPSCKNGRGAEQFALLMPGCSPNLLHKRWPVENYAELAKRLADQGIVSIAIGTKTEADTLDTLCRLAPGTINLCGQTNLAQIAALARRATYTIGNDTGPMHLAAAVGSPTLAILSHHTNPVWSRPYGPKTAWVKTDLIANVSVDEVLLALLTFSP